MKHSPHRCTKPHSVVLKAKSTKQWEWVFNKLYFKDQRSGQSPSESALRDTCDHSASLVFTHFGEVSCIAPIIARLKDSRTIHAAMSWAVLKHVNPCRVTAVSANKPQPGTPRSSSAVQMAGRRPQKHQAWRRVGALLPGARGSGGDKHTGASCHCPRFVTQDRAVSQGVTHPMVTVTSSPREVRSDKPASLCGKCNVICACDHDIRN